MPLRRAKPLDTLYEEVAAYDLVVVPEAPLASALNRRVDQPHLGSFAITPRRLAAGRREHAEDRQAFLELVTTTDIAWKDAAFAIGNTLQCWEHQGRVDAVLDYDAYADDATERTVDHLRTLDTTSRRLSEYTIEDGQDVAVVGFEQLTPLERSILPGEFETFSPFGEASFDRPPFHVFDSKTAIVDTLRSTVSTENADDVAIVSKRGSGYATLVRAALEAADVPFYGGPGFADHPHHRGFLQVLRCAHRGADTRVRDVQSVLTRLGFDVDVEHAEKRLHDLDARAADWLTDFIGHVGETTFSEALAEYERQADVRLEQFRAELDSLGIADTAVTEDGVDRLAFYLQSFEVPVDRENEGVLLANATAAAYVDRPVVFYLGLDETWTHSPPRRPWVDADAEYDRNLRQFQLLLQNGVEQYYLVRDTEGGSPVTPCLYFEELIEEDYERFSDLDAVTHTRPFQQSSGGFDRDALDVSATELDTISQSSLSTYVNCPRDYLFGRLLDSPDRDYFRVGNLFHDFAEFYVTHPDAISEDGLEDLVDWMLAETRPFLRDVEHPTQRTKFRVGLETIMEFLDTHVPEGRDVLTPDSGWGQNVVADHFGRTVDAPHTERWFENRVVGVKGKIDLVHRPTELLDYKSGSRKRASTVVRNSALDPPSDSPNYQALLYLAHWRTERPDEQLAFTFFHFLETLDDVVAGDADLEDTLTTVTYYPRSFEAHARSQETFETLRDEGAQDCRKTLSQVAYEDYRAVFDAEAFPDTRDRDALIDSEFGAALIDRMQDAVGEYKYVESGCKQALRALMRTRSRNYFREDLDAFEAFVDERLDELNRRRAGEERFPVEGLAGEPNYRYVDHRDLLLTDD